MEYIIIPRGRFDEYVGIVRDKFSTGKDNIKFIGGDGGVHSKPTDDVLKFGNTSQRRYSYDITSEEDNLYTHREYVAYMLISEIKPNPFDAVTKTRFFVKITLSPNEVSISMLSASSAPDDRTKCYVQIYDPDLMWVVYTEVLDRSGIRTSFMATLSARPEKVKIIREMSTEERNLLLSKLE